MDKVKILLDVNSIQWTEYNLEEMKYFFRHSSYSVRKDALCCKSLSIYFHAMNVGLYHIKTIPHGDWVIRHDENFTFIASDIYEQSIIKEIPKKKWWKFW